MLTHEKERQEAEPIALQQRKIVIGGMKKSR